MMMNFQYVDTQILMGICKKIIIVEVGNLSKGKKKVHKQDEDTDKCL